MKDEALRLALEALEKQIKMANGWESVAEYKAITAIKAALLSRSDGEAKGEPVAWMYPDDLKRFETSETFAQAYSIEVVSPTHGETVPLYTAPPQRTWVGLTDEEIHEIYEQSARQEPYGGIWTRKNVVRAIEAKLKEKNT
jgi:hypothetical protein